MSLKAPRLDPNIITDHQASNTHKTYALFRGRLSELHALLHSSKARAELQKRFAANFREKPSYLEVSSWIGSLPAVCKLFLEAGMDYLAVLEFSFPPSYRRCDLILLEGANEIQRALIIELKAWTSLELHPRFEAAFLVNRVTVDHPVVQVGRYAAELSRLTSLAATLEVRACVYLEHLNSRQKELLDRKTEVTYGSIPCFVSGDESKFLAFSCAFLGHTRLSEEKLSQLDTCTYDPLPAFQDLIASHPQLSVETILSPMLGSGLALNHEQTQVLQEILLALSGKSRLLVLVHGSPGSGKSLLATAAHLRALQMKKRSLIATLNTQLADTLRAGLEKGVTAARGTVISPSTRHFNSDLLVIDEAQRIAPEVVDLALREARVVLLLMDERQRLRLMEKISIPGILLQASNAGVTAKHFKLCFMHRCSGGEAYMRWVENLLFAEAPESSSDWHQNYRLRIVSDPNELVGKLRDEQQNLARSAALVASFTKTDGRSLAARIRVSEPPIRWCMGASEYRHFWLKNGADQLSDCASVYGALGLERDVIGILWGRDLVRRGTKWCVPENHEISDDVGDQYSLEAAMKSNRADKVIPLLLNRYWIFLTRGRYASYIHCEDHETAEFLRSCSNNGVAAQDS